MNDYDDGWLDCARAFDLDRAEVLSGRNEIDRLRAELAEARAENLHGCPRPDVYEHAAVLARATRAEAKLARVRELAADPDWPWHGSIIERDILRALDGAE